MADSALPPSPLQEQATVRALLPLVDHPRRRQPAILAWHVLELFVRQEKLLNSSDSRPGASSGDVLCSGTITRGAEVDLSLQAPWAWLDTELPWQAPGLRPEHQPLPVPGEDEDGEPIFVQPPNRTLWPPVEGGIAWLGDLTGFSTPGVLPAQPRAQLYGCTLLSAGFPFGPGGIGRLIQSELGERVELLLKPQRHLITQPGDTLQRIADDYATTVQTLRNHNPMVLPLMVHTTVDGETLLMLAGIYGTTVDWLMRNNPHIQRFVTHTVVEGDTLRSLSELYQTTPPTLRTYNAPYLDFYGSSDPLPIGFGVVAPQTRPSSLLDPGLEVLVPGFRPSAPLPPGIWVLLPPKRRSSVDPDDRSWLDEEPPPEPPPDPEPEPVPEPGTVATI
ncbi:MAG: LysM peptidoglycan-binding domain-containing protein [Prochlorococcaceae cyanobacterium]